MSASDPTAPLDRSPVGATPIHVALSRAAPLQPAASRRLRAVLESHWTPVIVSILAMLMLLAAASTALIQTRLLEMAEAVGFDQAEGVPAGPPPEELEFTLAPEAIRDITMDEAREFNANLPFSTLPIQPARPFIMPPESLADYARALDCMTAAIYYEAASETGPGQAAVAQVVLNRLRHPAFPKTVCGVVFQGHERSTGCQFSFTCDGAMARVPSPGGWARARAAATSALNGYVAAEVGMATHYHTDWVAPYWAERLVKLRQIGTHIFYRWTGGWGLPGAFRGVHAGAEPVIAKMAPLSTPVEEIAVPEVTVEELHLPAVAAADAPPAPAPEPLDTTAHAALPPPIETVAVEEAPPAPPPPAPTVMANPLERPAAAAPVRSTRRIAVPR